MTLSSVVSGLPWPHGMRAGGTRGRVPGRCVGEDGIAQDDNVGYAPLLGALDQAPVAKLTVQHVIRFHEPDTNRGSPVATANLTRALRFVSQVCDEKPRLDKHWTPPGLGRGDHAQRLPTTSTTLIALTATEVKPGLGMGAQLGGQWLRKEA